MVPEHAAPSARTVAVNGDLLTEILLRVPVRSLLRFKCVSKQWLALISSPQFSRSHSRRNPRSASALFLRRTIGRCRLLTASEFEFEFEFVSVDGSLASPPFRSLAFVSDPMGLKILQSCNGLLLCSSHGSVNTGRNYYIYNPSTNRFLTLPPLYGGENSAVSGMNLAFDPSKSPHYKVVCVRSTALSAYYYQTEIYSSETGAWRLSGNPFASRISMVFGNGVFWNGAALWYSSSRVLFYYDMDKERFGKMPLPLVREDWQEGMRLGYFGESQGHLHLIEFCGSWTMQFKIFEMERDYFRWFVKYRVDLDPLKSAFPKIYQDLRDTEYFAFFVLCLVREEKDEDSSLLLHIPGKIISYSLKDKTFKKLWDISPSCGDNDASLQFGWCDAFQYIESLSCV